MEIAIDASVLVALLNHNDLWNTQATAIQNALVKRNFRPMYFDCAVTEAVSAATRRLHEKGRLTEVSKLLQRLNRLIPRNKITWILPDVPHLYQDALNLMQTSNGELNFNDALIALACHERSIALIASFDPDFDQVPWLKRVAGPTDIETAHR